MGYRVYVVYFCNGRSAQIRVQTFKEFQQELEREVVRNGEFDLIYFVKRD